MSDEPPALAVTAPIRAGLNDTLADAIVAAEVKAALFGHAAPPVEIGRFRVVRALGQGAMGTVWLCRDDELARDVAVKLLRGRTTDERAQARMVREARALARLSHPNVVVVHEVGTTARGVHVAMEHVPGTTLTRWLADAPRSPEEILAVFVQAGRGLAAAHRVQVVHRDFKPDNVLIDASVPGEVRARVVDFGLARTDELEPNEHDAPNGPDAALSLTHTGALLGTPAYMAPEQLERGTADAKSDQFGFCVALFEALSGARPFTGDSVAALLDAMHGPSPRLSTRAVSPRCRAAIERGLAIDPGLRWPSMDALLAELVPAPRRSRAPLVAAAVVAAGLGTAWWLAGVDRCPEDPTLLEGAWDPATRARVEQAFTASPAPYASAVWQSTSARLDGYARDVLAQSRAACSTGRATEDARYAEAATACIDDARVELAGLAARLVEAEPIAIAGALHHAIALPDLGGCSDVRRLALAYPVPRDAARQAEARAQLAAARDLQLRLAFGSAPAELGKHIGEAIAAAERSAELALADEDRGLAAAAAIVHARLLIRRGEGGAADAVLRRASEHAIAIDDPVLRSQAMVVHTYVIGLDRDRADEAYLLGEQTRALLEADGRAELLLAQLDNNLGTVAARDRRDHTAEAEAHHRAALARFVAQLGDSHPDTLASRVNLAAALAQASRIDDALAELHATLEPALAVWGEDHPSTARLFGVLGNCELRAGRLGPAEAWMRRALEVQERAFGPADAEVASALYNLAMVLRRSGDAAGAIAALRRGLAIRERLAGPDSAELIAWLVALGESELENGAAAKAEPELRRALALCETDGAPAKDFARVRAALARAVAPRDRVEASVLAGMARATYRELHDDAALAKMDALLAELSP